MMRYFCTLSLFTHIHKTHIHHNIPGEFKQRNHIFSIHRQPNNQTPQTVKGDNVKRPTTVLKLVARVNIEILIYDDSISRVYIINGMRG